MPINVKEILAILADHENNPDDVDRFREFVSVFNIVVREIARHAVSRVCSDVPSRECQSSSSWMNRRYAESVKKRRRSNL